MGHTSTSKKYIAKNHFYKHMFLYNLHILWYTHALAKKIIGKSRIRNYQKHNVFVLSDEMARLQK